MIMLAGTALVKEIIPLLTVHQHLVVQFLGSKICLYNQTDALAQLCNF